MLAVVIRILDNIAKHLKVLIFGVFFGFVGHTLYTFIVDTTVSISKDPNGLSEGTAILYTALIAGTYYVVSGKQPLTELGYDSENPLGFFWYFAGGLFFGRLAFLETVGFGFSEVIFQVFSFGL